jgi:hypothetical protein
MATMNIEAITDAITSGRDDFDGGDVMSGFVITLRRLPAAGETRVSHMRRSKFKSRLRKTDAFKISDSGRFALPHRAQGAGRLLLRAPADCLLAHKAGEVM